MKRLSDRDLIGWMPAHVRARVTAEAKKILDQQAERERLAREAKEVDAKNRKAS